MWPLDRVRTTVSSSGSVVVGAAIIFLLLLLSQAPVGQAWSGASGTRSTFTGTTLSVVPTNNNMLVMYDHRGDPPSSDKNQKPLNAWNVLATTEQWISATLDQANSGKSTNPYSRKEVSYVCETSADQAMIFAGIFRRLKEARQLGQRHGEQEHERALERDASYRPNTLRQTQVVVIPSNQALSQSFDEFNQLIETVNAARRHARDYVTGSHLERMDGDDLDDGEEIPWSVSVNCAHLHPNFGEKTPEQELAEMKAEEEAGEVDLHYQEYQKQKMAARRSPYPTIVVEVRASPPPNFGASPPPTRANHNQDATQASSSTDGKSSVTAADIQKLEALFGQSAHMNHPTKHMTAKDEEEDFYARIGNSIKELSSVTPMQLAQDYIAMNDPHVPPDSSFTTSDAQEVDEAYEFVFTNFAMMAEQGDRNPRYYVVLPHFCAASATSLEKFTDQLQRLCMSASELRGRLDIDTYHPEHISPTRRAPVPVLSLQWKKAKET